MQRNPRIGLLPFYLKLYDELFPDRRSAFESFLETVATGFRSRGVDVCRSEIACVHGEFNRAVRMFEDCGVDLIVTLHLAYSPSLESVFSLCSTSIPILMLDTTMDAGFGRDVNADRIMYNHGIHGVQDLACMLRRRQKPFRIVAGHVSESNVLSRAVEAARAAHAARSLKGTRALRIGEAFDGMGDFSVENRVFRERFAMTVDMVSPAELGQTVERVTETEVEAECEKDRLRFGGSVDREVHRRSVRVGLGVRTLLQEGQYTAFSMNFQAFSAKTGPVDTVPFLEASKAMSRGIGYAGEGDVLTAMLVGALVRGFGQTTFTEIFCPDWAGNSLFLSHMGEINPDVVDGQALLVEKPYPFSDALNPAIVVGAPRPGPAVLVNLAPGPNDSFSLIVAPVKSLGDGDNASLSTSIRGWIRSSCDVAEFLERFSRYGGTHHSALVMGEHLEGIVAFADFAGLESHVID